MEKLLVSFLPKIGELGRGKRIVLFEHFDRYANHKRAIAHRPRLLRGWLIDSASFSFFYVISFIGLPIRCGSAYLQRFTKVPFFLSISLRTNVWAICRRSRKETFFNFANIPFPLSADSSMIPALIRRNNSKGEKRYGKSHATLP